MFNNKIAALTAISAAVPNAEVLTKDVSMQVASMGADTLSWIFSLLSLILN
jgi:elongation factor Ts